MLRGYSAYSGLTLKATHDGGGGSAATVAAPTFSPAPGALRPRQRQPRPRPRPMR